MSPVIEQMRKTSVHVPGTQIEIACTHLLPHRSHSMWNFLHRAVHKLKLMIQGVFVSSASMRAEMSSHV